MLGTRNYPLVIGTGVAVLIFALLAGAAVSGVLASAGKQYGQVLPGLENTAAAVAARHAGCTSCGVIANLEAVKGETGALAGYRVTLRMDDGRERSIALGSRPAYGVGARVRVVNGNRLERG